ncbi:MAG: NAD-dependent epimerase/dehydratase family protein [Proteobacteria bacterium]|nr:NAD-dependent epimerase/dehydratase family protein [Pseudomonadota bacterium]
MKVFVTGGNGFIGSSVVRKLKADGHDVRCLLRETSDTSRIEGVEFERHIGDLRDVDSLTAGMKGCDAVIHLASISSWDQIRSPLMRTVVVDGTNNVLEAATFCGKLRTVFVSSCTAIGATESPVVMDESATFDLPEEPFVYAHAKVDAEALCAEFFEQELLPVVIVSPCEVWGPNDDDFITAEYARDTLKDWPALTVDGGTALAHVDDIAAGIASAISKGTPGERYILGGENIAAPDLTRLILECAGTKKWVLQLPNNLTLKLIRWMAGVGLATPVNPDLLAHAVLYWFVDCSKAEKDLDYTYRSAKETVQDLVDWLKSAGHVK